MRVLHGELPGGDSAYLIESNGQKGQLKAAEGNRREKNNQVENKEENNLIRMGEREKKKSGIKRKKDFAISYNKNRFKKNKKKHNKLSLSLSLSKNSKYINK